VADGNDDAILLRHASIGILGYAGILVASTRAAATPAGSFGCRSAVR
jgi:hypothetical protein